MPRTPSMVGAPQGPEDGRGEGRPRTGSRAAVARPRTGGHPAVRREGAAGPADVVPEPLERRWSGVFRKPRLVAHLGWGAEPSERRVAAALVDFDGSYLVHPPRGAPEPGGLLEELRKRVAPVDSVLVGVDLPLGVPLGWAGPLGVKGFPELLPLLGQAGGPFASFFEVAQSREELAPSRPFLAGAAGPADAQRAGALGVEGPEGLKRACERTREGRALPGERFATVGSDGRAVVAGWRDLLLPAQRALGPALALWPFEGTLDELLSAGRIVVAETHPAALLRLLLGEGASLKDAGARRQAGSLLCERAAVAGVRLTPGAEAVLRAGGSEGGEAEADWAAVAGLLAMLAVVLGYRYPGEPADPHVRRVEGWAFGQG
jgi:hypothetical protein